MSKFIKTIEWWHNSNKITFQEVEKILLSKGLSEKESDEILEMLYYAVSNEYGN